MALLSTGTDKVTQTMFNSGYLTIGTDRFVELDNISIDLSYDIKEMRSLNSIMIRALKRSTFKCSLKGKVRSFNRELLGYTFGSSSADGTGTMYRPKDGQYDTTLNPIFTGYIDGDTSKPWQYQFTNAVITSMPLASKTEDYGEIDFEIIAASVAIHTAA